MLLRKNIISITAAVFSILAAILSIIAIRDSSYTNILILSDKELAQCLEQRSFAYSGHNKFAICRSWSTDNGIEKHALVIDSGEQILLPKGKRSSSWRAAVLNANKTGAYGAFADSGFEVRRVNGDLFVVDFMWRRNSEI